MEWALKALFVGLAVWTSLLDAGAKAAGGSELQIELGGPMASIESLTINGKETRLPSGRGGFSVKDATAKEGIGLGPGSLKSMADKTVFSSEKAGDIRLTAEFAQKSSYVLVTGQLENLKGGERGVLLDYCIPPMGGDAVFCNALDSAAKLGDSEQEGNVYPIAAMCGAHLGVATAIPPSEPRMFGMVGSSKGLCARFYLGLSPLTERFPNRAAFAFLIYPVDPAWGFRSALSRYYGFYGDYYTNRSGHDGLYLFLAEDGKEPNPPNLHDYGFDTIETQAPWFGTYLDRDRDNGILSLPYMIVGQREIKFLDKLPRNYDEAMKAYADWSLERNSGHPVTKEMEAAGRDANLRAEVDSSVCMTAEGKHAVTIRHTPWGLNSVTFTMNPNPDLFSDTHGRSVGGNALRLINRWNRTYPKLDGATIDSLGAAFPALLNYRKDHFRYARYPLTCDPDGRVALHNEISHYEFLEALRKQLQSGDGGKQRYIAANGLYSYRAKPEPPQHYRAGTRTNRTRLGRFFLAALLDFAVSEPGINSDRQSMEFMRIAMGRKAYSPTNARWTDKEKVEDWINKCLCYALFGVNVRHYGGKIDYYYPEAYERDKALFQWFVPKVRLLSRAGWEPVTCAKAHGPRVLLERYGSGSTVYFAMMSEDDRERECLLTLDLESLGFKGGKDGQQLAIEEMARSTPVVSRARGVIALPLKPHKTCIVAVQKKG